MTLFNRINVLNKIYDIFTAFHLQNLSFSILYQKVNVSLANISKFLHCVDCMSFVSCAISEKLATALLVEFTIRADWMSELLVINKKSY